MNTNSYVVTITPRVQTPVGNYFKLAPMTYEIPAEFMGVSPIEFPTERMTVTPPFLVGIPSNVRGQGQVDITFDVNVRTGSTPQGTVESVATEGIQA